MKKMKTLKYIFLAGFFLGINACSSDYLDLEPRGVILESNFYQTEENFYEALIATYDVLQWQGGDGWTMKLGLLNAVSDDTFAGGSNASDQPKWVAWDNFTMDPFLGPQLGFWEKGYAGIYRANLYLQKIGESEGLSAEFAARTTAEAKFLRAFYYFDLVRLFGNVPLITEPVSGDDLYNQTQNTPAEIYAQIEKDLTDAKNTFELPSSLTPDEYGRVTKGAVDALLGKVILFQNDESRMGEAADHFLDVINSNLYALEADFGDIFKTSNEFGIESVFEIPHSSNFAGGYGNFPNGTEGNFSVQFMGMRDYQGPTYATGWSFCPVTEKLVDFLDTDPRYEHTIIDGNLLKLQGATYTEGYQNTDYFVKKYAGLADEAATDGDPALNWGNNVIEIRYADVLLMAAEALSRSGDETAGKQYLNQVRNRAGVQPLSGTGQALLDRIFRERRRELATEGHRYFDLIRTGRAEAELGDQGFISNKHELLPIPQSEIDITEGLIIQNPGY